jgi:non-specific protein-tyrosine kinase
MELRQYFEVVRKWLWLMILTVVVAAASSYVSSRRVTPQYRTMTTLMVGRVVESPDVTSTDLWLGERLVSTYAQMAEREPVLRGVVEELRLDVDWRALAQKVSARAVPQSLFLEISVVDSDPLRAKALADAIGGQLVEMSPSDPDGIDKEERAFAQQEVDDIKAKMAAAREQIDQLQDKLDVEVSARRIQELEGQIAVQQGKISGWQSTYAQLLLSLQGGGVNVLSMVEEARVPSAPISPNTRMNVLLASASALVLAMGGALLVEYLDDTIKSADDLTRAAGLSTLGRIARINGKEYQEKLISVHEPRSPVVEAYRTLRTNIRFSSIDAPARTLVVTSPGPTEGKSVTLANLAVVMAQAGHKVVAVDSDLRRPVLHRFFGLTNSHGLSDAVLNSNPGLAEHLQPTSVENLCLLASGAVPPNPAELLGSQRMAALVGELRQVADVVLFDSPPSLVVTDAAILGTRVDGILVVVDAGRTRRNDVQRSADELRRVGANILGAVLNRLSARGSSQYYYRYYYGEDEAGRRRDGRRSHGFRSKEPRHVVGTPGDAQGEAVEPAVPRGVEPAEKGSHKRRLPAWGWALAGVAVGIVVVAIAGYLTSVYGLLPASLDARLKPYLSGRLPLAAIVASVYLLLVSVWWISTARSSRRRQEHYRGLAHE